MHDATRCFRKVFRKPIEIVFFEHLVARCKKKQKSSPKKKLHPFGGALKAYRNMFHFSTKTFRNPRKSAFL